MSKIDSSIAEVHNHLNPRLWTNKEIIPEVQAALLRIAKEFYEFLDFEVPLKDIQITGSQANYNYTKFSDLDLHLIVPYNGVSCDEPVEDLFDTKRKLWKARHTITIHGIPVEVYVEDVDTANHKATYSILTNKWLNPPTKEQGAQWDQKSIVRDMTVWLERMLTLVEKRDIEKLEEFKDQLKHFRQAGLNRSGEWSQENLVYKALRNLGAINLLLKTIVHLKDQDLSI